MAIPPTPEAPGDAAAPERFSARSQRLVLIVEDDPFVSQVLVDFVTGLGFEALVAEDGTSAVIAFERNALSVFLVILDYAIPGMHSAQLLARIRAIKPTVNVLIASGYPKLEVLRDFQETEIQGFIPKPFQPKQLLKIIERCEV